ncbi:MAG TPA: Gfo/Idh/MocA family oxidoreductase [Tepidisphaeraceae bacterium]|nr:Gfo/Idh/MocA family oxidoreductase [Tepidisphaeraceae bacterium]
MVKVGIIGLGMMGRTHYEAYQNIADAQVVAVSDQDPKRAGGDLSGTAGNVLAGGITRLPMDRITGTTNYLDLLARSDVDVVDVCVPTTQHLEVATAALNAGKHVVCEKPLARTVAEGEQIAAAARTARGMFMPAMVMRFWPQWTWLKGVVSAGTYGKVRSATFRRITSLPKGWYRDGRVSGGAVLDLHVHDVDFVYHLFGTPSALFSRGYSQVSGEIDHVTTQFFYDDVPHVHAEGSWCMADGFGFKMLYTVNFDNATAVYDLAREHPLLVTQGGKTEPVTCESGAGYEIELRYFINCVKTGERPSVVTADDAVMCLKLIDAERESVRSGQIVMFQPG